MKKYLHNRLLSAVIAFMASLSAFADVTINATNFPDDLFRSYVKNVDTNGDGVLSTAEIAAVTEAAAKTEPIYTSGKAVKVSDANILDLTGLKYFTNLEVVNIREAALNNNPTIDLSGLKKLKKFTYYNNMTTAGKDITVNLNNCTALEDVYLDRIKNAISVSLTGCNALKNYSYVNSQNGESYHKVVSNSPVLELVTITSNYYLSSVTVECPYAKALTITGNGNGPKTSDIIIDKCTAVEELDLSNNYLTIMPITVANFPNLYKFNISGNDIATVYINNAKRLLSPSHTDVYLGNRRNSGNVNAIMTATQQANFLASDSKNVRVTTHVLSGEGGTDDTGGTSDDTPDTTAPTISSKSLTLTPSLYEITVKWNPATDNKSAQTALKYNVYVTNSSTNLTTAIANGYAVSSDITGTTSTMSATVSKFTSTSSTQSSITQNTTYYINVEVCDEAGNKSVYTAGSVTTLPYSYNFWVGGVRVTEANKNDILGDGKVTYNSGANRFEFMDGANIVAPTTGSTSKENSAFYAAYNTTVLITGDVKMTASSTEPAFTVLNGYDVTFTTYGGKEDVASLTITSDYGTAVKLTGASDLTFKMMNVDIKGAEYGIYAAANSTLTLNNMDFSVTGASNTAPMYGFSSITLDGTELSSPTGLTYDTSSLYYKKGTSLYSGTIVFEPEYYNITVAGRKVNSRSKNYILGGSDKSVTYNPTTNILTLDHATISATGESVSGISSSKSGLTIKLVGTNNVSSEESTGLRLTAKATIEGTSASSSTLNVTSPTSIIGVMFCNTTIKNCSLTANTHISAMKFDSHGAVSLTSVTVDNANISAKGMRGMSSLTLTGCGIAEPSGANFNAETGEICYAGTTTRVSDGVKILVGATGIEDTEAVEASADDNAKIYDLRGIEVDSSYKGFVIKNGRKYVQK